MLYSCTHMATVGFKGLTYLLSNILFDTWMSAEIYDLHSNCFQCILINSQFHSVKQNIFLLSCQLFVKCQYSLIPSRTALILVELVCYAKQLIKLYYNTEILNYQGVTHEKKKIVTKSHFSMSTA